MLPRPRASRKSAAKSVLVRTEPIACTGAAPQCRSGNQVRLRVTRCREEYNRQGHSHGRRPSAFQLVTVDPRGRVSPRLASGLGALFHLNLSLAAAQRAASECRQRVAALQIGAWSPLWNERRTPLGKRFAFNLRWYHLSRRLLLAQCGSSERRQIRIGRNLFYMGRSSARVKRDAPAIAVIPAMVHYQHSALV